MLRAFKLALRTPRQRGLAVVMVLLAGVCVAAGTWQIQRFERSVRINNALQSNAADPTSALTTALVPLAGTRARPSQEGYRFCRVATSGSYLASREQYVEQENSDGVPSYLVVTPLRTADGILLVDRGAVGQRAVTRGTVPAPPAGTVRVVGRLEVAGTSARTFGNRITDIYPETQSARLGAPVFDTYLSLDPKQAGSAGLGANAAPDLSNPAGGAFEGQHFAYIIQWYLFALLALAAPFGFARHEIMAARQRFLGPEEDLEIDDPRLTGEQSDARLALAAGSGESTAATDAIDATDGTGATVSVRAAGTLARPGPTDAEWARATRLADRYGMSVGDRNDPLMRRFGRRRSAVDGDVVTDSSVAAHRSMDTYHAAYNDYLWQLALADGEAVPDTVPTDDALRDGVEADAGRPSARVVDESGRDVSEPESRRP